MALRLLLPLTLAAAALAQVSPNDLLKTDVPAGHTLAYGSGPLQTGELRVPAGNGPHPVVILVHGGCWAERLQGLDPRATSADLLRPLATALTAAGFATWNIEYRRAGTPGGGWPGSYQDLAAGTDFLRKIAAEHHLDLARVVVAGHSSGGQLAFWIAARPKLPATSPLYTKNPLPVKGVVAIDGPPDLAAIQPMERKFCGIAAVTDFIGGTPAQFPERYRDGAAPNWLPLGLPQVIAEGGLMHSAPSLTTDYAQQAKAKGDRVDTLPLPGAGHFDMLEPNNPHGKALIESLTHLMK